MVVLSTIGATKINANVFSGELHAVHNGFTDLFGMKHLVNDDADCTTSSMGFLLL